MQDLYNDFQRTTQQLVRDKLQEQRVGPHPPMLLTIS